MNMITNTQSEMAYQYGQKLKKIMEQISQYPVDYEAESRSGEKVNWNLLDKEGYHFEQMSFQNCKGMMLVNNENAETDKIVMLLHGGANFQGLEDKYLRMAQNYSKAYQNAKVLLVDFRLKPKYLYPAMLEDSIDAYQSLLEKGFRGENIVLAGDSAGGALSIECAMYLRDHSIEMPCAIITMSAVTDYTQSGKSWQTNADADVMLGNHVNPALFKLPCVDPIPLEDPMYSPMFAKKEGLPRMLMIAAGAERPLNDTLDFAKAAKKEGVDVTVEIYYGLFHVFPIAPDLPESKIAWEHIHAFLEDESCDCL